LLNGNRLDLNLLNEHLLYENLLYGCWFRSHLLLRSRPPELGTGQKHGLRRHRLHRRGLSRVTALPQLTPRQWRNRQSFCFTTPGTARRHRSSKGSIEGQNGTLGKSLVGGASSYRAYEGNDYIHTTLAMLAMTGLSRLLFVGHDIQQS